MRSTRNERPVDHFEPTKEAMSTTAANRQTCQRTSWWRRRRALVRGDRGVTAVEAAIVTPVLMLLLIGIIEFGLAFKDQLAITSAVRAGARIASAEPRYANFAADAASQVAREGSAADLSKVQALWVYKADSTGHPIGAGGTFNSCTASCVQFSWNASSKTFVQSGGSWPAISQDACPGEEDSVGVYLKVNHTGVTDVFFSVLGLQSYTVMRLEPVPAMQTGGCK
jgi:Flp pilus assembly protein TadG